MSSNPEKAPPSGADPPASEPQLLTDEEVAERHRSWVAEHGRVYPDEAEREKRLGIFRENLLFIEAHNRGGHPYTMGLNQFSDLTNEEFRATYCGGFCPPESDDPRDVKPEEGESPGKGD